MTDWKVKKVDYRALRLENFSAAGEGGMRKAPSHHFPPKAGRSEPEETRKKPETNTRAGGRRAAPRKPPRGIQERKSHFLVGAQIKFQNHLFWKSWF